MQTYLIDLKNILLLQMIYLQNLNWKIFLLLLVKCLLKFVLLWKDMLKKHKIKKKDILQHQNHVKKIQICLILITLFWMLQNLPSKILNKVCKKFFSHIKGLIQTGVFKVLCCKITNKTCNLLMLTETTKRAHIICFLVKTNQCLILVWILQTKKAKRSKKKTKNSVKFKKEAIILYVICNKRKKPLDLPKSNQLRKLPKFLIFLKKTSKDGFTMVQREKKVQEEKLVILKWRKN